ncbi:MAG TPA: hypothetical protein VKV26_25815 [Dehalococcoidia bacterium]|nr:hypothetical protein [Dehalococcoidia bacterium]
MFERLSPESASANPAPGGAYSLASLADLARAVQALCRAAAREIAPYAVPSDPADHAGIAACHAADSAERAAQLAAVLAGQLTALSDPPAWAPPDGWLPFAPNAGAAVLCTCDGGASLARDGGDCPFCRLPLTPNPVGVR